MLEKWKCFCLIKEKSCWLCCSRLCPRAGVWRWWCHSRALTTRLAMSELSGKQVDSGWADAGQQCECVHWAICCWCVCVGVCLYLFPHLHTSVGVVSLYGSRRRWVLTCVWCLCKYVYANLSKNMTESSFRLSSSASSVQRTEPPNLTKPVRTTPQLQLQELIQEYCILWQAATKITKNEYFRFALNF